MMAHIALLDDDPIHLEIAAAALEQAGHQYSCYSASKELLSALGTEQFDLLILDWMLPEISGLGVLVRVREQMKIRVPVLFLTGRDSERDIVQALESGADDYLAKPLRPRELIARTQALLRRARGRKEVSHVLEIGPFRLDKQIHVIYREGQPITMTEKEFDLSRYLLRNLGAALSRAEIQEAVWGRDASIPSRTLDTHISRVRTKLHLQPEGGFMLAPIYSYGYRLLSVEVPDAQGRPASPGGAESPTPSAPDT